MFVFTGVDDYRLPSPVLDPETISWTDDEDFIPSYLPRRPQSAVLDPQTPSWTDDEEFIASSLPPRPQSPILAPHTPSWTDDEEFLPPDFYRRPLSPARTPQTPSWTDEEEQLTSYLDHRDASAHRQKRECPPEHATAQRRKDQQGLGDHLPTDMPSRSLKAAPDRPPGLLFESPLKESATGRVHVRNTCVGDRDFVDGDFTNVTINNCRIIPIHRRPADDQRMNIKRCVLDGVTIEGARISDSRHISNCRLVDCIIEGKADARKDDTGDVRDSALYGCRIVDVKLENCKAWASSSFWGCHLTLCKLGACSVHRLNGAHGRPSRLVECSVDRCQLFSAQFKGVFFTHCDFWEGGEGMMSSVEGCRLNGEFQLRRVSPKWPGGGDWFVRRTDSAAPEAQQPQHGKMPLLTSGATIGPQRTGLEDEEQALYDWGLDRLHI